MLIGVVGAPNKGKSTFFSAATLVDAQIANYPFTTINPNRGVTYVRTPCPHVSLGLKQCNPKNSKCAGGTRLVPINIIDVAGLVPGAHEGKGLGNRFLDNLREADALIQVVDVTGKTDLQGNPCDECDPASEVEFLEEEVALWLADIMMRGAAKGRGLHEAAAQLTGLKIDEPMLLHAASVCGLEIHDGLPAEKAEVEALAREVLKARMPIVVAANKIDVSGAREKFSALNGGCGHPAFACSAAVELALRKAEQHGMIRYVPGAKEFTVTGEPDERQKEALAKMQSLLSENNGSGVQQIIDWIAYQKLHCIVVYPVEDEHRYSNHKGDVLPDAFLVPKGTTAHQLAAMVHTELAQKFVGAIDVRKRIRVGTGHPLSDGDVIKILASH